MNMKPSERIIELLKKYESFSAEPYNDTAGNATVGYGHLLHLGPVKEEETGMRWSVHQADIALRATVEGVSDLLNKAITVPVNQNQFDALVSWTYNCGPGALRQATWLLKLNKGFYDEVPEWLRIWNKITDTRTGLLEKDTGLTNRREKEINLFMEAVV
jgi:lysozyme